MGCKMQNFSFEETKLEGLTTVNPFFIEDERGFFIKSYEKEIFSQNRIESDIAEDFESLSKKGVIRGLHFQTQAPQSKLIRVINGEILDVAVDLRKNSKTFGKWESLILSSENKKMFFIPKGFAHGFLTLSNTALVTYKCTGKYLKEYDTGILWNDKQLNINWQLEKIGGIDNIVISQKDQSLQTFYKFKEIVNGL